MGQTGHLIGLSCDEGRGTQWWERKTGPYGTVFALFPRGAAWWSLPGGGGVGFGGPIETCGPKA
ncbi:hypothetical protein CCACVL1_14192 [Corchorus capsularis]|uniref:Uncharacterized protein n=1 Tax=Corchorus capsularis TaxID=210143 RepID=A0A1R3I7Z8_COCAP|nr:hypothetical protein CCACVL1_14192 [Corchorus capsularis]